LEVCSIPGRLRIKIKYIIQAALIIMLAFFSYLMLRLSLPYLAMRNDVDFLQTKQNVYHIDYWRTSFYVHVFTSIFVLIAGLTQFNTRIQKRYKIVHRLMGYIYVLLVVFITGPASFMMGWHANGGLPARTSFTLLSFLWMVFTLFAWWYATRRKFLQHRAFMIRSYALTLSAITLRVYTFAFAYFNVHARPVEIYITTAWLSWVPNLIIAEMIISYTRKRAAKNLTT
jgi:hypothetical protein